MAAPVNSWNNAASSRKKDVSIAPAGMSCAAAKKEPRGSFFGWVFAQLFRLAVFITFLAVAFWAASGVSLDQNQDFWSNTSFDFTSPRILFERIQAFIQAHWMG
ncbi:MAG: hypothetical protein J6S75_11940 [Thermoguttaceae bacterium]|nr:hypothetical protein [Thermoguttaceae bacterium]